jgi:hypothetical protein
LEELRDKELYDREKECKLTEFQLKYLYVYYCHFAKCPTENKENH